MDYPFVPLKRKIFKTLVKEQQDRRYSRRNITMGVQGGYYDGVCSRGDRWGSTLSTTKKEKMGIDTKEQGGGQWMENY